jgi:hypothetical protein
MRNLAEREWWEVPSDENFDNNCSSEDCVVRQILRVLLM